MSKKTAREQIEGGNFKKLYQREFGEVINKQASHTPQQVFDMAVGYFTWAEENLIKAAETASFQGDVTETAVHKARIFTLNGFCLFCGVSHGAFAKWRKDTAYSGVTDWIDSVIYEQKWQLAANGIVNPGFIAKDLGLDKPASINVDASSNAVVSVDEFKDAVKSVLDDL